MAKLVFLSAAALGRADVFASATDASRAMTRLGLSEMLPFILDNDGRPVTYANRWIASLRDTGCSSTDTWRGYATDFKAFFEFLRDERATDPLRADSADWGAYYNARRITGGDRWKLLAGSSWNRQLSALERFYGWAYEEGLRSDTPFRYAPSRYVPRHDGGFQVVRRNLAAARRTSAHVSINWLEADQLQAFLRVGLGGLLPTGEEDPGFRGRNATRNRVFGEFMADTGVRVSEAAYLLNAEIVTQSCAPLVRMLLPAPICKGQTHRIVEFGTDVLRRLRGYQDGERQFLVARSGWLPDSPLIAARVDRQAAVIDGKRRSCGSLSKQQRRRLLTDGGCALLWVRSDGAPMTRWSDVFADATRRCRQLVSSDFPRVSPHTLRHTFAVHTLRRLNAHTAAYYAQGCPPKGWEEWFVKRTSRDPLGILQSLLGHENRSTTAIYTDVADGSRLAVSMAEALELDAA